MVRFIEDMTQWNDLMELSKTKVVLVDFTASWYVILFVDTMALCLGMFARLQIIDS